MLLTMKSTLRAQKWINRLRAAVVLSVALAAVCAGSLPHRFSREQTVSYPAPLLKRMLDGKEWLTENLNVNIKSSYCYADAEPNCRRYGRLYTWGSAQQACRILSNAWRLPTDDEWRQLAKRYGGIYGDSADDGKDAYKALMIGGSSGFNAVLGGGRAPDGQYSRSEAHGFYWTASNSGAVNAVFYNFGHGGSAL